MSEMRQLLRYEIPGLLIFIYTFIIITPFIEKSTLIELMEISYKLVIALAIIAIPTGWLLYQIYDTRYPKYYKVDSIKLLKNWITPKFKKGKRAKKETIYEEFVNIFLINDSNSKNKNMLDKVFADKRLLNNLSNYWDHYDARHIIGKYVPIGSGIIVVIVLFSCYYTEIIKWPPPFTVISIAFILFLIIFILSHKYIYEPRLRILDEINTLQCFLILFNKEKIDVFNKKYSKSEDLGTVLKHLTDKKKENQKS